MLRTIELKAEITNSTSLKLNCRVPNYSELIYGSLREMDRKFKWMFFRIVVTLKI